jgi:hypothetical protein
MRIEKNIRNELIDNQYRTIYDEIYHRVSKHLLSNLMSQLRTDDSLKNVILVEVKRYAEIK